MPPKQVTITKKTDAIGKPVDSVKAVDSAKEVLIDTSITKKKITGEPIGAPSKNKGLSGATPGPTKVTNSKSSLPDLFDDDNVDYRYIMTNYDFTKNKTRGIITKYEKALLIGKRAKQIESGAISNVKVLPGQNAIDIAEEELRQRKIPLIIKRPIGNRFEYWKPEDMEVDMD